MDTKTIQFIKKNYKEKAREIEVSMNSTNSILEDLLKSLNAESKVLQRNKKFKDLIELVKIQQGVYGIMEEQSKLIDILKVDNVKVGTSAVADLVNIDYDQYSVDTSVAYDLKSDFRHKRPYAISINGEYINVSTWREMLIKTAEYLNNLNPELFNTFIDNKSMRWGDRVNFTKNAKDVREPKLIEGSDIYIEINKGSIAVRQLVIKMIDIFNIDMKDYKVFLRADYTPIHEAKIHLLKKGRKSLRKANKKTTSK